MHPQIAQILYSEVILLPSPQPVLKCKRQKGTQYVCPPGQDVRKSPLLV
jgi:hypothetical protein